MGDLIGLQHDLWQNLKNADDIGTRAGGRILGMEQGGSNDIVLLDRDIENELDGGKTYELVIRLSDDEAPTIKTVVSVFKNRVSVSGKYTGTDPAEGDLWAIGEQNEIISRPPAGDGPTPQR